MFDWQTEEDESLWDDESTAPPKTAVSRKRTWLISGAVIFLMGFTGWLLYQQLLKQADAAVANVESDILSSHNLVQTAANTEDADLLRALLSGRDMGWAELQQDLVADGLFWERPFFAMQFQPDSHEVIETTIDPALEAAEVVYTQSYDILNAEGVTETVVLQNTAVYRRGSQRWLYSPQDDAFWGEWETTEFDRLMLVYPTRDQEIAERLFDDFIDFIDRACAEIDDLACNETDQIIVRLEKDPTTIKDLGTIGVLPQSGLRVELPAPSLVGVPVDDAGYDALMRGYAGLVVTAVIADAVSWECCDQAPIFETLLAYQLGQLRLRPWTITIDDHITLWEEVPFVSLDNLIQYWDQDSSAELSAADTLFLETAMDFMLRQHPNQSAAALQRQLSDESNSFIRWVRAFQNRSNDARFVSPSMSISLLDEEWRLYALLQKDVETSETLPVALPEQDIQLLCMQDFSDQPQMMLTRYRLGNQTWEIERETQLFSILYPTIDEESVVLLGLEFSDNQPRSIIELWDEGQSQLISGDGRYVITLGQFDPTGRYLAGIVFPQDGEAPEENTALLFDLNDCDESGCSIIPVPGLPVWSPSGERAIYVDSNFAETSANLADGRVWMVDDSQNLQSFPMFYVEAIPNLEEDDLPEPISEGQSVFWLDEERFGFVQSLDNTRQQLVLMTNETEPEIVLETMELIGLVPEDVPLGHLSIQFVRPNPTNSNQLFVIANDIDGQGYVFFIDLETGEVAYRFSFGQMTMNNNLTGFSPNGRYLATIGSKRDSNEFNFISDFLTIHDIEANHTDDYLYDAAENSLNFVFDWSTDGEWLLTILDDGLLQLIAPAYNYRQIIEHDFGECQMVTWINR
jgi:hypothetical protein